MVIGQIIKLGQCKSRGTMYLGDFACCSQGTMPDKNRKTVKIQPYNGKKSFCCFVQKFIFPYLITRQVQINKKYKFENKLRNKTFNDSNCLLFLGRFAISLYQLNNIVI